jgi:hypothetical protein
MAKFKSGQFEIDAKDANEAKQKFAALSALEKNIKSDDLIFLAEKVKADPGLIEKAKGFL